MNQAQELKLIRSAAAGDRGAAASLIQAHQRSLYAFMLRISGKPDVAEDMVQEAFVRVLTHLDRFNAEYRFSTWLFTIARRLYLNWCERKKPGHASDDAIEAARVDSPGPCLHEAASDADEFRVTTRARLQDALLHLSPEQREVVVLFHQHGWSLCLIAEQLEIPLGTVKSHLHRGRTRLRELMTAPVMVPKKTQKVQPNGGAPGRPEVDGVEFGRRRPGEVRS